MPDQVQMSSASYCIETNKCFQFQNEINIGYMEKPVEEAMVCDVAVVKSSQ